MPMPYQAWLYVHALELLPNGFLRFSYILLLVSRQNGKTEWASYLIAYFIAHGRKAVLGTSATLETALESWEDCVAVLESLEDIFGSVHVVKGAGRVCATTQKQGAKYKIASANRKGGRGKKRIDILVEDELREHETFEAHAAADSTTTAVPDSITLLLSNAGDVRSVVLNHFRNLAIAGTDPHVGHFEWSADAEAPGFEISDRQQWRQADPALGFTITEDSLASKMTGPPQIFKTENLCIGVPMLKALVQPSFWASCLDPGTLDPYRRALAVCVALSPDLSHISLVAAAVLPDDRVRVETVRVWDSTTTFRSEIKALLTRINPRVFGWLKQMPAGPNPLSQELAKLPRSTPLTAANTAEAVTTLAELIGAARIAHNGDELLQHQICAAPPKPQDAVTGVPQDGTLAVAGAVWLARGLPKAPMLWMVTENGVMVGSDKVE